MRKELSVLRQRMKEWGIDAYIIPTEDFHGSENVGEYFKSRRYVSGFTGSAGTLIVLSEQAGLWTDGRYYLQAEEELCYSGITLYKAGSRGAISIEHFLKEQVGPGQTLAFDGRCMMSAVYDAWILPLKQNGVKILDDVDLVGEIWADRPALAHEPVWKLPAGYEGVSVREKLKQLREDLAKQNTDILLLSSLDDIAWLLNVRGHDIRYSPVVLSYLMVMESVAFWYVNPESVSDEIREELSANNIRIYPYEQIYEDITRVSAGQNIFYDPMSTNVRLRNQIPEHVSKTEGVNPVWLKKAVKNPVEVEHARKAHIKDGIAVTHFMYWLKHLPVCHEETEISASDQLLSLRKEQEGFLEESFAPIIAAGPHGAIVHYGATQKSNQKIPGKGFLLCDTGAHYLEGTTDITRTFAMGPLTEEEKRIYTIVLKGHIDLACAKFLPNCSGRNLDMLARTPLWCNGLDYGHGTGHGVGSVLNVHEGPVSINVATPPGSRFDCPFEEGMITSNEPGCYLQDKFGVRLENLMLCKRAMNFGGGKFLEFETLTMVPFDLDAILPDMLTTNEVEWLNAYHTKVWKTLLPYMTDSKERQWFTDVTRSL